MDRDFYNRFQHNNFIHEEKYVKTPGKSRVFTCRIHVKEDEDLPFLEAYKKGLRSMLMDIEFELYKIKHEKK